MLRKTDEIFNVHEYLMDFVFQGYNRIQSVSIYTYAHTLVIIICNCNIENKLMIYIIFIISGPPSNVFFLSTSIYSENGNT